MSVARTGTVESDPDDMTAGNWQLGHQASAKGKLLIFGKPRIPIGRRPSHVGFSDVAKPEPGLSNKELAVGEDSGEQPTHLLDTIVARSDQFPRQITEESHAS